MAPGRAHHRVTAGNYRPRWGAVAAAAQLSLGAGYRVTRHKLDVESFVILGFPSNMVVDAKVHGPMFSATLPIYASTLSTGYAEQDTGAVCGVLEKMAGVKRKKKKKK
jgi:hypothetical protein